MVLPKGEVRRLTLLHLIPSLSWACRIALLMGKPGFVSGCRTILCSFLEGRTRTQLQTRGRSRRGKRSPAPIYSTCHFIHCAFFKEVTNSLSTCWKLIFIHTCYPELIASSSQLPCLWPRSETKSRQKVRSWFWGQVAGHYWMQSNPSWDPSANVDKRAMDTFH